VTYHIYGPIEDEFIWDDCKKKINKLPKNISVEYKGSIEKNNVTKIFEEYDLMFLPSFGENYGHVIVESLSVGTPVLLSDKTPWRNLSNKGLGWDIPLNEPDKFVTVIEFMAHLTIEEKKQMKLKTLKNSLEFLNDSKLIEDYKKIFKF
jgi:glycosyltransferase involved in cell wall biosynthesis